MANLDDLLNSMPRLKTRRLDPLETPLDHPLDDPLVPLAIEASLLSLFPDTFSFPPIKEEKEQNTPTFKTQNM